jgi:hypothetical protein
MFIGSRTSISIRLEWPDYPSWAQQVCTAVHLLTPCLTVSIDENEGLEA